MSPENFAVQMVSQFLRKNKSLGLDWSFVLLGYSDPTQFKTIRCGEKHLSPFYFICYLWNLFNTMLIAEAFNDADEVMHKTGRTYEG